MLPSSCQKTWASAMMWPVRAKQRGRCEWASGQRRSGAARAWGGATHGAKSRVRRESEETCGLPARYCLLFPGLHPSSTTNCNFVGLVWATPPLSVWGLRSNPVGLGARSTPRHCACSCPLT
eukprot:scaffold58122_cov67-Phaeocystis_antarctica.AAC.8